jgi:hypothetical protein
MHEALNIRVFPSIVTLSNYADYYTFGYFVEFLLCIFARISVEHPFGKRMEI